VQGQEDQPGQQQAEGRENHVGRGGVTRMMKAIAKIWQRRWRASLSSASRGQLPASSTAIRRPIIGFDNGASTRSAPRATADWVPDSPRRS
jgi:hypothetical protein